jgi:hypothetical protein
MENAEEKTEELDTNTDEENILAKMEELRKYSHDGVTDEKLRQGAKIALGIK